MFGGTALCTLLVAADPDVGFGPGESVFFALSIAVAPAVFVAVGALTSQLGRTRRVATTLGMVVFGVAFVLRMIADSGSSTRWLLWLSPFGWIERMRPLTDNDPRPLVLAAVTVVVLVAASVVLAARRDVGAGTLASRDVVPPRRFGLGSPWGLAVRLELPVLVRLVRRGGRRGLRVRDHREGGDRRRALLHQRHARQVRRAGAASWSSTSASPSC